MNSIKDLKYEIDEIKNRNTRVEADKAWESSGTRKVIILVLTYIVIIIFFHVVNIKNPFISAITPTLGFFLSTLTMPIVKKWWIVKFKK